MVSNQLPDNGGLPVLSDRLSAIVESVSSNGNRPRNLNNGVRASRVATILALILSAIPMGAMAKGTASLETSLIRPLSVKKSPESLKLKDVLQMPQEQLKAKLETMNYFQIKELADQLLIVADDAKGMPDVGDALKANTVLGESEKAFFMEMADKYNITDLATLKSVLNKKQLTPRDFEYLLVKCKEILRQMISAAQTYNRVRSILDERITKTKLFDSTQDSAEWADVNNSNIQAFKELIVALQEYIDSL